MQNTKVNVCIIGIWHLGAVYSTCLADLGYNVVGVDQDRERVENLNKGIPPLFEPNLGEVMFKNINSGTLKFTTDLSVSVQNSKFVLITYDTKVDDNDEVDLSEVYDSIASMAKSLVDGSIVIVSSQVPVGTCELLKSIIEKQRPDLNFDLAYVPENLRLGQAIHRFMNPERIVIGADNKVTLDKVEAFFSVIKDPKLRMSLRSAEMTKHALNAFLATSISFANEIANICDEVDADALEVVEALRLDSRIGSKAMLKPGLGFAGGTLARDIKALQKIGLKTGYKTQLIDAVFDVNQRQNKMIIGKLQKIYGSVRNLTIGVFGLTYKPGTSTLRRSASLEIIKQLFSEGAQINAYDPKADLREMQGDLTFKFFKDPVEAAQKSDALIFVTEWPEFKQLDFGKLKSVMKKPVIIDAQNLLDTDLLRALGFTYLGVGRGHEYQLTSSVNS